VVIDRIEKVNDGIRLLRLVPVEKNTNLKVCLFGT
jgi:hypothetical protein